MKIAVLLVIYVLVSLLNYLKELLWIKRTHSNGKKDKEGKVRNCVNRIKEGKVCNCEDQYGRCYKKKKKKRIEGWYHVAVTFHFTSDTCSKSSLGF